MSNKQQNSSEAPLTTVKTVYARAAIILLALNFGFTVYLTYSMNKTQSDTLDTLQERPTPQASVNLQKKQVKADETIPQTLDK